MPRIGPTLAAIAVLLVLNGMSTPGAARAQEPPEETVVCFPLLELPPDLAGQDLVGLRAALRARVAGEPEATVTLHLIGEGPAATIRADLLLADGAALAALLERDPVNITGRSSAGGGLDTIDDIEASTKGDCERRECRPIGLPAALRDLDAPGLRAALEGIVAEDAAATVWVSTYDKPAIVRADLLLGLGDPVVEALLAGRPLIATLYVPGIRRDKPVEVRGLALPGEQDACIAAGGQPRAAPGGVPDAGRGEMPEELPDTGAGGLGTGASVPRGSFGLAVSGLLAAGYAVIRR